MVKRYYGGVISANLPATVGGAFYSTSEAAGEVQKGTWPVSGLWYNQTVGSTFFAASIDVDSEGNVYVCGTENGTQGAGSTEGYLMKYSSAGVLLWQKMLGDGTNGRMNSVSVSADGQYVFVCGGTGTPAVNTYTTGVVAKYSSSGSLIWQIANSSTSPVGVKADNSNGGCVVSATYYNGTSYFATTYALDSAGARLWVRASTYSIASADFYMSSLDVSATTNNIVSVGRCNAQYSSFGSFMHRIGSGNSSFNAFEWQVGSASMNTTSVSLDSSDTAYIANWYATGSPLVYYGLLTKIDSAGTIQWVKVMANTVSLAVSTAVRVAADGYIYLVAHERTTDTSRILVNKVNSSGTIVSQHSIVFADGSDIYIFNDSMSIRGQHLYLYIRKNPNVAGSDGASISGYGNAMILKLPLDLSTLTGTRGPITISQIASPPTTSSSGTKYTSISTGSSGGTSTSHTLTTTIPTFTTSTLPLA